jgi:hypothetical protein
MQTTQKEGQIERSRRNSVHRGPHLLPRRVSILHWRLEARHRFLDHGDQCCSGKTVLLNERVRMVQVDRVYICVVRIVASS